MVKLTRKRSKKIGLSPGTMVYTGERKAEEIDISIFEYDKEKLDFRQLDSIEESFPFNDSPTVSWLNINGLHDIQLLEKLGKNFNIHQLILEDILNTDQRPKLEIFDDYIYLVLKMINFDEKNKELEMEQVSFLLGKNFVISFQEKPGDLFNPIRDRIKANKGRIRKCGSDYLVYALIDIIVDHYFLILERLGEQLEDLDVRVISNPGQELVQEIQHSKRELIFLRKSVWPLREVISNLMRDETDLISEQTAPFLRDLYDHTIQVIDTVEIYRDMDAGILDIYLSTLSNKMNEVMKVLTIIATIFIPLTFLAGVYGMNFEFMPELKWPWAYPAIWAVMVIVFVGMLFYFKRKKWL